MKDDRVRIKFDDEVLQKLKEKHKEVKEWIPSATLSNVVNGDLKQFYKLRHVTPEPTNQTS